MSFYPFWNFKIILLYDNNFKKYIKWSILPLYRRRIELLNWKANVATSGGIELNDTLTLEELTTDWRQENGPWEYGYITQAGRDASHYP